MKVVLTVGKWRPKWTKRAAVYRWGIGLWFGPVHFEAFAEGAKT